MFIKTLISLYNKAILVRVYMKIDTPILYGRSTLNNSPLLANSTNFPYKLWPSVYTAKGASNIFPLGSTYPLKFTGQAVYSGSSYQVLITYDS